MCKTIAKLIKLVARLEHGLRIRFNGDPFVPPLWEHISEETESEDAVSVS